MALFFRKKMLKIFVIVSSIAAVFIPEYKLHAYGASTNIVISSCDGQMKIGKVLSVNYTAINSHCNCTIFPRYNGSLIFASNAITENCSTEVTILQLQQAKPSALETIPCKGERQRPVFKVTRGNMHYMISRSVNTTTEPEGFLQEIRIFGIADVDGPFNVSISVTCGSTFESSSAKASEIITTRDAKSSLVSKTSPDEVSTFSKTDLENFQPPSSKYETQYTIFVYVGSGIVVIAAVILIIIFCKRKRHQEKGTAKSDKQSSGGKHDITSGNNELPYNPRYHSYNNEADGGYSTMEDVNRSPCGELPDNPLYHSHQENILETEAANLVEEKTGKEDIPMSETGSNAIYAQPNKVPKAPKPEVEDITPTENVYSQVSKNQIKK